MSDPIAGAALIIAIFSGIGTVITALHIKRCNAGCCKSDCSKGNSPPNSPPPLPPHEPLKKKGVSFKDENHSDTMSV